MLGHWFRIRPTLNRIGFTILSDSQYGVIYFYPLARSAFIVCLHNSGAMLNSVISKW